MFSRFITSLAGQLFTVLFGLAIVSACSMKPVTEMPTSSGLQNTHWQLKSLAGYVENIERLPTISFAEDRLSGFNGCNRIFADYVTGANSSLSFSQMGSTRMACIGQAGAVERAFNQAIANTSLYAMSRNALNLMDAKRNVLMVLVTKPTE